MTDEQTTQRLNTEGADLLTLAGVNDANLIELQRQTGTRVALRGDTLTLVGHGGGRRARDVGRAAHDRRGEAGHACSTPDDVLRMSIDGVARAGAAAATIASCCPASAKIIQPKTPGQAEYLELIAENDIVVGIGPAGTGKTYLAVAAAVDALTRKRVRRIVLARPAVEAGESLGFLPGDMQAKVDPYLRPLYDALEDMMPVERMQKALETRTIEIAPLAYMRGRTLGDAFVILDEAQNATAAQMKMFLTRLGVNSKTVITGDKTQIDLPKREESGLMQIERILTGHRRHRVPLPERDGRRAPPAGARDHQGVRRGRRRLNAMAGWLGGGDADDGSPRGSRASLPRRSRARSRSVVAVVTYLSFPRRRPSTRRSRGGLGRAGQRHRAVRLHGPQVAGRAGEGTERHRPIGRADLQRRARGARLVARARRPVRAGLAAQSPARGDGQRVDRGAAARRAARRATHDRRRRSTSPRPSGGEARRRSRAPRVRSLAGRGHRRRRACSTRCRARSRCAATAIDESVNADSIPTFAIAARARAAAASGPAVARRRRRVPQSCSTAFFRPTIVYDRVATERARQELRRSVPNVKYALQLGEKIVGAHEVVGREEHEKMRALQDELAAPRRQPAQREPHHRRGAVQHARPDDLRAHAAPVPAAAVRVDSRRAAVRDRVPDRDRRRRRSSRICRSAFIPSSFRSRSRR